MRAVWLPAGVLAFAPGTALAGMPVYFLTDVARLRLETISLFLLVVLVVGLAVQRIWNRLGLDFERLPRLSYRGALAFVVLWGFDLPMAPQAERSRRAIRGGRRKPG